MMWGAFSSKGKLTLAFISSKMNSQDYQAVLQQHLVPYLYRKRQTRFTYQQDNAAIHVSASSRQWFAGKNITLLDWPACSPDGNPIENLWGIMVRRVYGGHRVYQTKEELKTAIENVWNEIDLSIIHGLVSSMPNRIFQMINRNGNVIDY
jgi:transposase